MATLPIQYMRKYRLVVRTWGGSEIELTGLRFTFHIEKNYARYVQYGAITIYNLSPDTETDLLKNGQSLFLEAGYENGPYGVVFASPIRQMIRGKENGTDYFLKIICYAGDELDIGFCNLTISDDQTQRDLINQIARSSSIPFDVNISQALELQQGFTKNLDSQKTQRGKAIFGKPGDYLRSIAINNNAVFYYDDGVARFDALNELPSPNPPDLNATNGLIKSIKVFRFVP